MENTFVIIGDVIGVLLSLCCLICVASIISRIVRRHVLEDRQRDLVCRINLSIQQHSNEVEIVALKDEEQNVFKTILHHKHMILMNVVNILILLVLAIVVVVIIGLG